MTDTSESVSFNPDEAKKLLDNQIKLTDTLQKDLDAKDKKIAELSEKLSSREATIADMQSKIEAYISDASNGLAGMVVACHVLLDRKSVVGVNDVATYQSATKEYSKRTIDSLKDSLNDSIAELLDKVIEKGSGSKKEKEVTITANKIVAEDKAEQKAELSEDTSTDLNDNFFLKLIDRYSKNKE